MNKDQYLQARAEAFSSIDAASPDARPCISVGAHEGLRFAATVVLAPTIVIVGAHLASGLQGPAVLPAAAALVGLLGSSIGVVSRRYSINHYVAQAAATVLGKSVSATDYELKQASAWSRSHPEVSSACERWSEAREIIDLSQREYAAIQRAVSQVEQLDKSFDGGSPAPQGIEWNLYERRRARMQQQALADATPGIKTVAPPRV